LRVISWVLLDPTIVRGTGGSSQRQISRPDDPCRGGDPDYGTAQSEQPEGRRHQQAGQQAGACAVTQDQGQGDQDAQADDEGDGCSRQQAAAGAGIAHPAAKLSENRPAVTDDDQRGRGGVRAGRFARASPLVSLRRSHRQRTPHHTKLKTAET